MTLALRARGLARPANVQFASRGGTGARQTGAEQPVSSGGWTRARRVDVTTPLRINPGLGLVLALALYGLIVGFVRFFR